MNTDPERRHPSRIAIAGIVLWTGIEYLARRLVGPRLERLVDDQLASDMLIGLVEAPVSGAVAADDGLGSEARAYRWTPRALVTGFAAGIAGLVSSVVTVWLDDTLFGGMDVELVDGETSNMACGLLLIVNGVVGPVAEKFAWCGVVQTSLVERLGPGPGIAATSVAFAGKHAVVDRSIGRFATLLTLGTVFGVVRHRLGTSASTIAHVTSNVVASTLTIVTGRSS